MFRDFRIGEDSLKFLPNNRDAVSFALAVECHDLMDPSRLADQLLRVVEIQDQLDVFHTALFGTNFRNPECCAENLEFIPRIELSTLVDI